MVRFVIFCYIEIKQPNNLFMIQGWYIALLTSSAFGDGRRHDQRLAPRSCF